MHIRITDTIVFPYDPAQLRIDHPNISFPADLTEELLKQYGVFKVAYEDAPAIDQRTQYIEYEQQPTLVNNSWIIKSRVIEKDQEAIAAYDNYIGKAIKTKRDALLANSDWIVIKATENNMSVSSEWKAYRQALRDITAQPGFPYNIVWPVEPGGI